MAILEQVLEQMLGNASAGGGGFQGILRSLFQGVPGGMNSSGTGGGLSSLVRQLEAAGLGHIVQSWVSNGPNLPISPDQLRHALGRDQVEGMARQGGVEPDSLLWQLSQLLPGMVDRLTPDGRLPDHAAAGHPDVANPFEGGTEPREDNPFGGPGQATS